MTQFDSLTVYQKDFVRSLAAKFHHVEGVYSADNKGTIRITNDELNDCITTALTQSIDVLVEPIPLGKPFFVTCSDMDDELEFPTRSEAVKYVFNQSSNRLTNLVGEYGRDVKSVIEYFDNNMTAVTKLIHIDYDGFYAQWRMFQK